MNKRWYTTFIILYVIIIFIGIIVIRHYQRLRQEPDLIPLTNSFFYTNSPFLGLQEGNCDIVIGGHIEAPKNISYLLIIKPTSKNQADASRKMLQDTLMINGWEMNNKCQKEYMEAIREDYYVKTGNN